MFTLKSQFTPTGDQPVAIDKLVKGIKSGHKNQVLLGVTGSGKTFTMANIIKNLNMPALIISHNKTLAGQLYQEMRDFFPTNAISYFVSYYDYYQPEAYIPASDTYIEKEAEINELIDKLRLASTTNILTRKDVVVVASVSCIYNIGSPSEYSKFILEIKIGQKITFNEIAKRMVELLYDRSEFEFKRGTFRIRGDYMDIYPAYEDWGYRIFQDSEKISKMQKIDPLSGVILNDSEGSLANASSNKLRDSSPAKRDQNDINQITIFPAKHYLMDPVAFQNAEAQIRADLKAEYTDLKKNNKIIEAERLLRKVNYDLEMIKEVGYVNGIENYSRYFDGRKEGDPPYSLLEFFRAAYGNNFLVFIDESHMTVPQLRGMYNGDQARKKNLIDFGFRLHSALDNRPLKFDEFYNIPSKIIYVSATPAEWEIEESKGQVAEQLIRPTGILDPKIIIRPATDEIQDLIKEIEKRVKNKEKILVTTLTKKTAEDLSEFLNEKKIRAAYLHSDIITLERSDVLDNLRKNVFDVLIGVNLLREGLDLPEVTLVAILDADREGFLRSRTSLVQTMGRAARNVKSSVILYADVITKSITAAVNEIERRRELQEDYNKKHNIIPKTIYKPLRDKIAQGSEEFLFYDRSSDVTDTFLEKIDIDSLTGYDKKKITKRLEREMQKQAENLNFELAIKIRDKVKELKS